MTYDYEKLDENYKVKYCPMNDYDGSVTGHIVFGVKAWFDENPDERKRLGWTKHLKPETKDIEYNRQTQYLQRSIHRIDEYTVEDVYHVADKSEEMMALEEIMEGTDLSFGGDGITFYGGVWRD